MKFLIEIDFPTEVNNVTASEALRDINNTLVMLDETDSLVNHGGQRVRWLHSDGVVTGTWTAKL